MVGIDAFRPEYLPSTVDTEQNGARGDYRNGCNPGGNEGQKFDSQIIVNHILDGYIIGGHRRRNSVQ